MKKSFFKAILATALGLMLTLPAFATKPGNNGGGNGGCGVGQTTNGCGTATGNGGNATGGSSSAQAAGVGLGVGVGMGGQGGKGGDGGNAAAVGLGGVGVGQGGSSIAGGGSVGNTDIDASTGNTYVLPAPAVTYVPASNGSVLTKSHAVNLLVFSWSKSDQEIAPDSVAKEMIADMERLCQFETASMLRQRRYALVDPSYRELPAQPGVKNLTAEQCAALRK